MLNAVIREVLRLYPPIPLPMGRVASPGGTTLGGYYIPGGVSGNVETLVTLDYCMP